MSFLHCICSYAIPVTHHLPFPLVLLLTHSSPQSPLESYVCVHAHTHVYTCTHAYMLPNLNENMLFVSPPSQAYIFHYISFLHMVKP